MDIEIFKDVIGYEGLYQISNMGRVKSMYKGGRILAQVPNTRGYLQVGLSKNKGKSTKRVHQLMAIAFLNHEPCGMKLVINHINHNKLDNNLENIEVISQRDNTNKKHIKSSSKYVGVCWDKGAKKWSARIHLNGIKKYLGIFINELDAHNAYQNELKELHYVS